MATIAKPTASDILAIADRVIPGIAIGNNDSHPTIYDIIQQAPRNVGEGQHGWIVNRLTTLFGGVDPVMAINYDRLDVVRKMAASREDMTMEREPMPNGTRPSIPDAIIAAVILRGVTGYRRWIRTDGRHRPGWDDNTVRDLIGTFVSEFYFAYLDTDFGGAWCWNDMAKAGTRTAWQQMHAFVKGNPLYRRGNEGGRWACEDCSATGRPTYPVRVDDEGMAITEQRTIRTVIRNSRGRAIGEKIRTRTVQVTNSSRPECPLCGGRMRQGFRRMDDVDPNAILAIKESDMNDPSILAERADQYRVVYSMMTPELQSLLRRSSNLTAAERSRMHRLLKKIRAEMAND